MGRASDRATGPDDDVLAAFGGTGRASLLAGGQGSTFVDGDVVLKPAGDEAQANWAARVLSTVTQEGFRTPRPIMSRDGRWVVDGWTAFERVDGAQHPGGPVGLGLVTSRLQDHIAVHERAALATRQE